jgi:hypothetical protein
MKILVFVVSFRISLICNMQEKNQTPAIVTSRKIELSGNPLAEALQSLLTALNSYRRARYSGLYLQPG